MAAERRVEFFLSGDQSARDKWQEDSGTSVGTTTSARADKPPQVRVILAMPKLTPAQIDIATEDGPDGHRIGRDPRRMTQDDLRAIGHEPMPLLEVVRARCLDCCGGSAGEVRKCMAPDCPSWPHRMGTNPWR